MVMVIKIYHDWQMFEKCLGKERFTEDKNMMSSHFDNCHNRPPSEYLKNNVIKLSDVV